MGTTTFQCDSMSSEPPPPNNHSIVSPIFVSRAMFVCACVRVSVSDYVNVPTATRSGSQVTDYGSNQHWSYTEPRERERERERSRESVCVCVCVYVYVCSAPSHIHRDTFTDTNQLSPQVSPRVLYARTPCLPHTHTHTHSYTTHPNDRKQANTAHRMRTNISATFDATYHSHGRRHFCITRKDGSLIDMDATSHDTWTNGIRIYDPIPLSYDMLLLRSGIGYPRKRNDLSFIFFGSTVTKFASPPVHHHHHHSGGFRKILLRMLFPDPSFPLIVKRTDQIVKER